MVGLRYGSFVASAADSYGYITQAETFAGAPPIMAAPRELTAAWDDAIRALTPLGYLVVTGGTAPVYPPGYPLMMAAFMAVGGHGAMFLVVPICALVTLLATFALGKRLGGVASGVVGSAATGRQPCFSSSRRRADERCAGNLPVDAGPVRRLTAGRFPAFMSGLVAGAALLGTAESPSLAFSSHGTRNIWPA